jgi:DNA-binding NarL/FixJ family response regulator
MATAAIVDDHMLVAETVRVALVGTGIDAIAIRPNDLPTLLAELRDAAPTLVLLDLDLGSVGDSTELIAPLVDAGIRVLVVTGAVERERIAAAIEQGALGYCKKSVGLDGLVAKVSAALRTAGPLDPDERHALLGELSRARRARALSLAPFLRLTEREQKTLLALADGRSVHEIARQWMVSDATVRTHVRGVLTKLGAPSQLAAVAAATRGGWLNHPDKARIPRSRGRELTAG